MNTIKLNAPKPLMIAHRGLSALEHENTCAAFIAAGNRSYFGIETDVHQTSDGKYAIIHDSSTARVSGVELTVEETELSALRQLQLLDPETNLPRPDLRIPTLEEYIFVCKKYGKVAVLELKNRMPKETIFEIAEIVSSMDYMEHTVFISFKLENLIDLREKYPHQPAQYLLSKIEDAEATLTVLLEYDLDLDVKFTVVTEELMALMHGNGRKVNVWTVDTLEDAERLAQLGVDFITTNILE